MFPSVALLFAQVTHFIRALTLTLTPTLTHVLPVFPAQNPAASALLAEELSSAHPNEALSSLTEWLQCPGWGEAFTLSASASPCQSILSPLP
jgi:hypothetical protein